MPGLIRDLASLYQWIQDPDKDQRQRVQDYLAANPGNIQGLSDAFSNTTDPNKVMQTLGLRNARFGYNSNAGTNIANQILSTPQSQQQQAINTENLNKSNVNNPNYAQVANIAQRGMSPEQQFDATQQAYAGMRNGTANAPNYLSQDQKDLLQRLRTGQTSLDVSKGNADINLVGAEALSAGANADRTRAEIPGVQATSNIKQNQSQLAVASDKALDMYYNSHPEAKGRRMTSIFSDPTVDLDVRSAFLNSPKYGDTFKQQYTEDIDKQRIDLEKKRNSLQERELEEWLPRMQTSYALQAFSTAGFQGPQKGYLDLYQGNTNTPEALQAADILKHGSVKDRLKIVDQYNSAFNYLQKLTAAKNPDLTNIQTQVGLVNSIIPALNASGIDKPMLKYDITPDSNLGLGKVMMNKIPYLMRDASKPHSLQTVDGGIPTVAGLSSPDSDSDIIDNLISAVNSGADLQKTLTDPRMTPAMRQQFLTKYASQKKK